MMLVTHIAAFAEGRILGSASGGIPWDLPRDRAHFRARTAGRWLLVGRKTYGEMEGWFGDRTPIVLTRDTGFLPFLPGHRVATSVSEALDIARANGVGELIVCGGAGVFAATLPFAHRLLLTRIDLRLELPDPVRFPDFSASGEWALRHVEVWAPDEGLPAARFEVYERIGK